MTSKQGSSRRNSTARRGRSPLFVGGLLVAAMTMAVAPAVYAKGGKSSGGPSGDSSGGVQACSDMKDSLTLAEVNAAIGADTFHADRKNPITGSGVDVAVIDTGVNEVGVQGVIDGPDLSFDALDENLRYRDLNGHGTNMAGIIASSEGNHHGVAPGSRIVNVKVGAADGALDVSQVIAGIDWVVENRDAAGMNIRVINLAFGTDADTDYRIDPLAMAVENAWHNGIVVVVAGGNDGRGEKRLGDPALDPYVIAVAASELAGSGDWKIPNFSSTGDDVRNPDLVAPGTALLSLAVPGSYLADTYPAATCIDDDGLLYLRGSGTSQAAAVASGAVAMLLEQRPDLTPDQVKALLTGTATNVLGDAGVEYPADQQGNGMLNLAAALNAATPSAAESAQTFPLATGGGSLEDARGTMHPSPRRIRAGFGVARSIRFLGHAMRPH